jgi:hypothetical protein
MSLGIIVGFFAMMGIGFYAGFNYAKSKLQVKIKKLNNLITDLDDEIYALKNPEVGKPEQK